MITDYIIFNDVILTLVSRHRAMPTHSLSLAGISSLREVKAVRQMLLTRGT